MTKSTTEATLELTFFNFDKYDDSEHYEAIVQLIQNYIEEEGFNQDSDLGNPVIQLAFDARPA